VNIEAVAVKPDLATASYTAIHDSDGELLHAVSDMRIFDNFVLPDFETIALAIESSDAVVLDANLPEPALVEIVEYCRGKIIVADCVSCQKCKRLNGVLSALSLLKVNLAEAIALIGSKDLAGSKNLAGRKDEIDEALLCDLHKLGPSQLLLSAGSEGVAISDNAGVRRMSVSPKTDVVSTSGAGDALLSGVLAARLYGKKVSEQLRWGSIAAAETVGVHSACSELISRQLLSR